MKAPIIDITGKSMGQADLPDELFGVEPNAVVLAQYLRVYQMRQRQAKAKAQTRAEVTGTTAKVWRQKGTGRARHGSRKAPIFVKGGQAHGPTGDQNYKLTMSKKLRQLALVSALSTRAKDFVVISGLEKLELKTKSLAKSLTQVAPQLETNVTLILDSVNPQLINAGKNIPRLKITQAHRLNPYEILNSHNLLMTSSSIEVLGNRLGLELSKPKAVKKEKSK